ncbi:hypothetical protein PtrSN002B_009783 [Pyrenophora tritici-repentis]|uniref:Uncharacterized protein n=1 Tax=Pyrenophora tritici-repentis TaxID=45151 RepID=A0A2W1GDM6_9PLEO|nr:hypothetical protein PtrV1_13507 [Pyrenophora tritici-repentis]KAF7447470.1 hypothetical protein A1F99_089170 [Pyrenophora tritici-repentis]KAG9382438.1 hypothetical protein A1F94_006359 [Pyrenophora tritici-repentis]KAI0571604.1 hypothetical protein Alg215_10289 [Pyrenophora tritici-repentis]KAI0574127.1 hypothetical protein Alg130_09812 [Pyrenophora tritici-repentis]
MKISQSCTVLAILAFTHATPVPADNPQSLALLPRSDSGSTDVIQQHSGKAHHRREYNGLYSNNQCEEDLDAGCWRGRLRNHQTHRHGFRVYVYNYLEQSISAYISDLPGAPGGDIFAKGVNGQASAYEDITIAGNHNLKMEFKSNY